MPDLSGLAGGANIDFEDLRDEFYTPTFKVLPPELYPDALIEPGRPTAIATGVRSQGARSDCVGQALAGLIDIQWRLQRSEPDNHFRASGRMLHQLARFYDSYGDPEKTHEGIRTLRAAIKAFHHHGACPSGQEQGAWDESDFDRTWPNREQADAAEGCVLGGYRRLQPILNHYHSAISETHAMLVSARTHGGWFEPPGGKIALDDTDRGYHAFLLVGFTREGFLVLNSWGADWGGYEFPGGEGATPCPGVALWTYEDWSRNIADGWVLRLGVPGRSAFAVSGKNAGHSVAAVERRGSTPYRELRGSFLNLAEGRCVETGAYPTPDSSLGDILDGFVAQIGKTETKGVVFHIPGVLEPLGSAFARAVRTKDELLRDGRLSFTCFWCSELAAEIVESLSGISRRASLQGSTSAKHLGRIFEKEARGAGRAFWRDIVYNARVAAGGLQPVPGGEPDGAATELASSLGVFGRAYARIETACRHAGKPFHVVADGAGILVFDALIESRCGDRTGEDVLSAFTPPTSLSAVFPAIPFHEAKWRLLPVLEAMETRNPGSARIFVPTPEVEERITVSGYPGSILKLAANAFLDPDGKRPPRMLGTADEDRLNPRNPEAAIFQPVSIEGLSAIDDLSLAHHPNVEKQVREVILREQQIQHHLQQGVVQMPKITLEDLQKRYFAGDLAPEEMQHYLIFGEDDTGPFSVSVRLNPETVELPGDRERSALFLNLFNETERFKRKNKYYGKLAAGYTGPRIAAEGDSWFLYPFLLWDIIDCVGEDYAVLDTSAAGDLLENISARREYIATLRASGAKVLLLSAGGNDLCAGGKLANHLEPFDPNRLPADYLKRSYQGLLDNAIGWYERICRDVRGNFPDVTIICHGYDYTIPNRGRWLGRPMESRGITDRALQKAIAREMVDQFNRVLRRMAETLDRVEYVDCRNSVAAGGWRDELHPENPGFRRAADRIIDAVRRVTGRSAAPGAMAAPPVMAAADQAISLHVGLNEVDERHYAGWRGQLWGCENDARAMRELADSEGWSSSILLTADATRSAVTDRIRDAAATLKPGGQFLLSISCHGGQIEDFNGDENSSGPDSTFCLYDSQIIDDELYDLWSRFEAGVRIMVVADSCHSGSVVRAGAPEMELYSGSSDSIIGRANRKGGSLLPRAMPSNIGRRVQEQNLVHYRELARRVEHVDKRIIFSPQQTNIAASVLLLSACQDEETALDGDNHGIFTQALLKVWARGHFDQDYTDFHRQITREINLPQQRPNLLKLPPEDPSFIMQRPFTIWGRNTGHIATPGQASAAAETRPATMPGRRPIADLLISEGDENDGAASSRNAAMAKGAADDEVTSRFAAFMAQIGLRHFAPEEFLFLGNSHHAQGSSGFGLNSYPPEDIWPNIVGTARLLDELRGSLNAPVRILSAYRNDAYNRAIGGVGDSMHKTFKACDIDAVGVAPSRVAEALLQMRKSGRFSGGIGRYATFTHVDTRGVNADWAGNGVARGARRTPATISEEQGVLLDFASYGLPIRELPSYRSRGEAEASVNLATAEAAVNGPSIIALDDRLPEDTRRAVLYSTQFAQRAADASANPAERRSAWWAVYVAALKAAGWVTTGSQFRRVQTDKKSGSIDSVALGAIGEFISGGKLAALGKLLEALRAAPDGDRRMEILDLYCSEGGGGIFQLAAAEPEGQMSATLALGAVQFANVDRKKRIAFISWGAESGDLWVAAEKMSLNLDFYNNVARPIIEQKVNDAERLILAFSVAAPVG